MREWIYGRNPVWETLAAGRRSVFELRISQGVGHNQAIERALAHCQRKSVPVVHPTRAEMDEMGTPHQGIALQVGPYPYVSIQELIDDTATLKEPAFFLILDMLQDPQNLGTLLRTAEAVGVHGVLIPPKRAAQVTPAVVSASSGASEHLSIAQGNLASGLNELKKAGAFIYGLAQGAGTQPLDAARLDGPIGLVVGNEGQGMRRLVREACDVLLELPMRGRIASLNAAVAGSVALYFIQQARQAA